MDNEPQDVLHLFLEVLGLKTTISLASRPSLEVAEKPAAGERRSERPHVSSVFGLPHKPNGGIIGSFPHKPGGASWEATPKGLPRAP